MPSMAWPVPVATVGLVGYRPAAPAVACPVALLAHPADPTVVVPTAAPAVVVTAAGV